MIRRGTSYGPMLPDGVLEDDGADRGIVFVFAGAHLKRQFEFVKTQWLNDGIFIGAPAEKDPLVGRTTGRGRSRSRSGRSGAGCRTCRPSSSPAAASTASRPGLRALRWLAELDDLSDRRRTTWPAPATGTDRWKALDFGPPPADRRRARAAGAARVRCPTGASPLITLNRPQADNAITTEMGARLTEVARDDRRPTAVRVAVITGAGDRAFSVGSDLRQRKNMTKEDWLRQRQDFDRTLYTLRQLRKPIFAAVNGIAYGGGSEIAQSTDFIIASDNATFGQPEAMIGLSAGGGSPVFLPRLLPPGKALQMLMTGRPDHRAGGVPAGHGQRAPPAGRADGCGAADRREDREQLARPPCRRSSAPSAWAKASRSSRRSRS